MISIHTNVGAMVALESLNSTNTQLQATQKQISTGYRVADATDDGGAYAVAQNVRASVSALTSVNEQLNTAQGLLTTTNSALTDISSVMSSTTGVKALLGKIADQSITSDQRYQYVSTFKALVTQVANDVDAANYNGQNLVGKAYGGVTGSSTAVINSDSGSTQTLHAADNSGLANTLAGLIGLTFSRSAAGVDSFTGSNTGTASSTAQSAASLALTATSGTTAFVAAMTNLNNQLNQVGADTNLLNASVNFNNNKIDALNAGLGSLVDADLSKEAANLQALQTRQQLATQALSMANQAPNSILSLFR